MSTLLFFQLDVRFKLDSGGNVSDTPWDFLCLKVSFATPWIVLFILGDWNAKVGSQETHGVTEKFGLEIQNEAGQRLTEFCQENALVIANTLFQQHKRRLYIHMDITRWPTPKSNWLYSLQPKMESLYTVSKNKTGSCLCLRSWTPYCQTETYIEKSGENH